jgi:putative transposase
MIDRKSKLSIKRQCALLKLPRSTAYYKSAEVSEADQELMRRIDEWHLNRPFAGSRMLRYFLQQEGHTVGRRHIRTLMRKMGIEALYRKPNTSRRHEQHKVYPYLLWNYPIVKPNQVWAADISVPQKAA